MMGVRLIASLVVLTCRAIIGGLLVPLVLACIAMPSHGDDSGSPTPDDSVWRQSVETVIRETLGDTADLRTRAFQQTIGQRDCVVFRAEAAGKITVEYLHNADPAAIAIRYGQWFEPFDLEELYLRPASFPADVAATTNLHGDGTQTLVWRTGNWFFKVRRLGDPLPMASLLHSAAEKHRLYDFAPERAEPMPDKPADKPPAKPAQFTVAGQGLQNVFETLPPYVTQGYIVSTFAAHEGRWIAFLHPSSTWQRVHFVHEDGLPALMRRLDRLAGQDWHVRSLHVDGTRWGAALVRGEKPPDQEIVSVASVEAVREMAIRHWDDGCRLWTVAQGHSQWVLVFDKQTDLSQQHLHITRDFEGIRKWIREQWDDKRRITAISEQGGIWLGVASHAPELGKQRWRLDRNLDRLTKDLATDLDKGLRVSTITHTSRGWLTVLSRSNDDK